MRARASRRCEQLYLDNNGIGAAGAAVLADALMANRTLRVLGLSDNSIGDEGAAALARALATNHSLREVCLATGGPMGEDRVVGMATALHTHMLPSRVIRRSWWWHSFFLMATSLAMWASRHCSGRSLPTTRWPMSVIGAGQRCGLHVRVRVPCPHWLSTARAWQIF